MRLNILACGNNSLLPGVLKNYEKRPESINDGIVNRPVNGSMFGDDCIPNLESQQSTNVRLSNLATEVLGQPSNGRH
jgi:hypothetical protein